MTHTPTPWLEQASAGNHSRLVYDEANGKTIATVHTDDANAEFIVRAVNAHDALVMLLQDAHDMLAEQSDDAENDNFLRHVRSVLAQAKGADHA